MPPIVGPNGGRYFLPSFSRWGNWPYTMEFPSQEEFDCTQTPRCRSSHGKGAISLYPIRGGEFYRERAYKNSMRIQVANFAVQVLILALCFGLAVSHFLDKEVSRVPVMT